MIRTHVKLQVLAFAVVSLLGLTYVGLNYVGLNYVGLGDRWFGGTYVVRADFASSGGIFTGAAVTYRGVQVGRVGALTLRPNGVRVDLMLRSGTHIPSAARAVVADRSAVGEQYVDLRPDSSDGPYLGNGSLIPLSQTGTPLPVETLLVNLDRLVNSVDRRDLEVVIAELGKAFAGTGANLQRLLDSGDLLLAAATDALPQTIALIRDGRTVLESQIRSGADLRRWSAALATLTAQLRDSDPDLRRLLARGPSATSELTSLIDGLRPNLGFLLGNLTVVGDIQDRRLAGLEQILVTYPSVVAGGFTVVRPDAGGGVSAHFGLVLNADQPPPCRYDSGRRFACSTAERAAGSSVRGAANAPRPGNAGPDPGGDARPATDPTVAGYDPATGFALASDGRAYVMGSTGGQQRLLGSEAWKSLLIGGLGG